MQHVFLRGALTKQALACLFFVHACNMYFALEACPSTYDLVLIFNLDKVSERDPDRKVPPAEHPPRTPCAFLAERADDDRPQKN